MAYSFENLDVWKAARCLVVQVYGVQAKFPPFEKYGLGDQLRRAAVSVPSNIAEGSSRISIKEQLHFIEIAYGSLMEVYCQLLLACDLKYVKEHEIEETITLITAIGKMLNGLRFNKLSKLRSS